MRDNTARDMADAILDAIDARIAAAFAARDSLGMANGVNLDAVARGEFGEVGSGQVVRDFNAPWTVKYCE